MFSFFRDQGKIHIDEITPLDVQLLFRLMDKEGKSEAKVLLFPEALEVLKNQPRHKEVYGKVPVRDSSGGIVEHHLYPANFVFPKKEVGFEEGIRYERYTRVDNVRKTWNTLKRKAGVEDLQLKDLRTYFNYILKNHYGFPVKKRELILGKDWSG